MLLNIYMDGVDKMCVYVSSEVLLANMLQCRESVSPSEIQLYCTKLREVLHNEVGVNSVCLEMDDRTLEKALARYEEEFRLFQGRFYRKQNINVRYFNDRFDENISSTFERVAQAILKEE